jgi:hypothetical protein
MFGVFGIRRKITCGMRRNQALQPRIDLVHWGYPPAAVTQKSDAAKFLHGTARDRRCVVTRIHPFAIAGWLVHWSGCPV